MNIHLGKACCDSQVSHYISLLLVVSLGLVRSGLLTLFPNDWDCNRSYWSYISLGLRLDCGSLMNCSLYRL